MQNKYTFCHLHRHCEASIQDGVGKVEDGIKYAKEMGHPAIAVTDHGSLISYVRFQNESQAQGIKHIFGLEAYVCDDMTKKDKEHKEYNHCTILVKNQQGLQNILKINNTAQSEGFYYKPRISWDYLLKHKEGLIILSGCVVGRTCQYILAKKYQEADAWTRMMRSELGEDYYIELMVSDFEAQKECNQYLLELSKKFDIPGVVTADAHYTKKQDYLAQKTMMLISAKATVQELEEQQRKRKEAKEAGQSQEEKDKIWIFESDQYWMKNETEMIEAWDKWHKQYYPFAEFEKHLNESGKISNKVNLVTLDDSYKMPQADVEGEDHDKYFRRKLYESLKEKKLDTDQKYIDQLENEINIITQKGLIDYFIVTSDIIQWAKRNDVFVGPGRGSAGGSLVCYLLHITDIDPLKYGLLFERFLDLGRQEMPDIDTDFEIDEREKVKQYIVERYGKDYVAAVSAFGTFRARNIVRDIARVYGVDPKEVNEISKLIDEDCEFIDGKLYKMGEEFHKSEVNNFFTQHPQIKDIATTLFGQIRHVSKHAAGVIVTNKPLDECVPTINVGGEIMTAWSEGLYRKELSQLNFLKLDILGLKTLSIIKMTCRLAKINYLDLLKLDNEDPIVYDFIIKNELISGIFQFDSNTGSWLFNFMGPRNFNDLVALGALDRPGPLDSHMAFEYVDKMHGEKINEWQSPLINEVLGETHGVIVYQEQLMSLSKHLSNFSPLDASRLRKNLVKMQHSEQAQAKVKIEREKLKKMFFENALKKNVSNEEIERLWEAMLKFARYGFNKAHAAGYAFVTYWTMWLKVYYPLQFYTAMLTYAAEDDIPDILNEMKKMGIDLQPPSINKSEIDFSFDEDLHRILFGLSKVKFLGTKAQEEIIKNRPFASYEDMCMKIPKNILNKRAKEALIRTNAFRDLGEAQGKLLKDLERDGLSKKQKELFESEEHSEFYSEMQQANDELKYLGTSLKIEFDDKKSRRRGSHVEGMYREYQANKAMRTNSKIFDVFAKNRGDYTYPDSGISIERFCGFIQTVSDRQSKSGNTMKYVVFESYGDFDTDKQKFKVETMRFYIMNWDKMYKQFDNLKKGDAAGIAIYKRKNKNEFMKVERVFKFTV